MKQKLHIRLKFLRYNKQCLEGFILINYEKRYSDDLDFFTHANIEFNRGIREIKIALSKKFTVVEEVTSKDFIRFKIEDLLQIDFVNDRIMRYESLKDLSFLDDFDKEYKQLIEHIEKEISKR